MWGPGEVLTCMLETTAIVHDTETITPTVPHLNTWWDRRTRRGTWLLQSRHRGIEEKLIIIIKYTLFYVESMSFLVIIAKIIFHFLKKFQFSSGNSYFCFIFVILIIFSSATFLMYLTIMLHLPVLKYSNNWIYFTWTIRERSRVPSSADWKAPNAVCKISLGDVIIVWNDMNCI